MFFRCKHEYNSHDQYSKKSVVTAVYLNIIFHEVMLFKNVVLPPQGAAGSRKRGEGVEGAEHSLMDEHRLLAFICDKLLYWKVFDRQYLSNKGCIRVAILISLGWHHTWHIEVRSYAFKTSRQCFLGSDHRPEKPRLFACLVRLLTIISAERVGF